MFNEDLRTGSLPREIFKRRENVFLLLTGLFFGSLTMLNILGITRIINIPVTDNFSLPLTVGVLAYPITFLCTDFISELYGRRRANAVVWVGLILNFWVLFILWLGGVLPPEPVLYNDSGQLILDPGTNAPTNDYVFYTLRMFTFSTITASMIAYLLAQFCDVQIFHFLKKKTGGKHLWLRNNGSTMISQMVDSIAVILISHYLANAFSYQIYQNGGDVAVTLIGLITAGYAFKFLAALLDTIPFYFGTKFLNKYLQIESENPLEES